MDRKVATGTAEVTTEEVRTSLRRVSRTGRLAAIEESALRMRHGVGVDSRAPLARASGGNEALEDELLLLELQLLRAVKAREGQANAVAPKPSRTKEKIVRALRKKH